MRFDNDIDDKQDCILFRSRPFLHPTPIFKETHFHGIKQFFLITQNTINVTIIKNAVYYVYVISSIVLDSFRLYM